MRKKGAWTWGKRIGVTMLALLVLTVLIVLSGYLFLRGSLARLDGSVDVAGLHGPVRVERDSYGVPMVRARSRADVAYAVGYLHAQERYFQMDLLRRSGAGELAELFGPKVLPDDRRVRLHRFRARAEQAVAAMPAEDRVILDRYVAGVNEGLAALRSRPFEYVLVGQAPQPWKAADSLLVIAAMYLDLQANQERRERARGLLEEGSDAAQRDFLLPRASGWDAPLDGLPLAAPAPLPATPPAWWGKRRDGGEPVAFSDPAQAAVGSNNWAVAGSRSASGAAIVADDMHLNLRLPNIWYRLAYEVTGTDGQRQRVVGVTLPGAMSAVVAGSNGRVAWGYTNSYGDFTDLIMVGRDAQRPGQVQTLAGWETPVVHEERIRVKGEPDVLLKVSETSAGPLREAPGVEYVLRWVAHLPGALNTRALRLEQAASVAEALDLAPTLGIPAQNLVAGDATGQIGWTLAGMLVERSASEQSDPSYPLRPGRDVTFAGPLAPAVYPRIVNPASGQLWTANSRQLMGSQAGLLGDGGFDLGARASQIRDGLTALGAKTDLPAVAALALDDRALFIGQWRARAMRVLRAHPLEGHPQRAAFLEGLERGWDGRASVTSTGYPLARQYMWSLNELLFGEANHRITQLSIKGGYATASPRWPAVVARLLDERPAAWLPAGFASWDELELAAIDRAIATLSEEGSTLKRSWGEHNTLTVSHPITHALPVLKRWLAAPSVPVPGDYHMPRIAAHGFGQSERMTVSPGHEEEGLYNMSGGQSGHPLSPHFLRGHDEWVTGKPLPLLPGAPRHVLEFVPIR
jgi:penicillin amidase